ncbi:MAG: hypothetical protein GEU26_08915 [Nitrososphaeraceae archaeon]|nr:hypothetical protein [Nitrososphaeraceae archaeon]
MTDKKVLLEKAIDLRILERKFRPEENETLTEFTPRFHEALVRHMDRMKEQGMGDRYRFDWLEMAKVIADYWIDISGKDGMERLTDMAKAETPEFREMCALLVSIISRMPKS